MVGVPRSKSCFRCLHRRKRCDSRRPDCSQCESKGFLCPGYRARFRFVPQDEREENHTSHTKVASRFASPIGETRSTDDLTTVDDVAALQLLPSSLRDTASQLDLYSRFRDIYNPCHRHDSASLPTDLRDLPSWEWILPSMRHSHGEPLLCDIVLALVLGTMGKRENNVAYIQRGLTLHTRAVKRLQKQVQNHQNCLGDDTLAAVMVFGIYEIQIGSESRGKAWLTHVHGVDALLQLYGKSKIASPFAKQLVWASQYNRWVIAMRRRGINSPPTPPILHNTNDETIPSDVTLFSILRNIAPLMAKFDQFQGIHNPCCSHQRFQITSSLLAEVKNITEELCVWRSCLQASGLLYWEDQSSLYYSHQSRSALLPELSTMPCFSSIRIATAMLFHWTGLLFLHSMRENLVAALPYEGPIVSDGDGVSSEPGISNESFNTALCTARSFEYFLHPDIGLFGTYIIGFPLAVARSYFEQRMIQAGLCWLEVIEARIEELGSGLGDFLREVKSNKLPFGFPGRNAEDRRVYG